MKTLRSVKNPREFFGQLSKTLGLQNLDGWYNVPIHEVKKHGGSKFLQKGGLPGALTRCYPEHDWKVWKFQGATKGLWKDFPQQHRAFFDWLGSRLNVKTLDDWYKFKTSDIKNIGDKNILDMYGNTLIHALTSIYPEHPWKIFRFQTVTDGYWDNMQHRREFFDWIGEQLGVLQSDDWYSKTYYEVAEFGDKGLMQKYYGENLTATILNLYPEFDWHEWRFHQVPVGWFNSEKNQRRFFDWLSWDVFEMESLDGWYNVDSTHVEERGGRAILHKYGGSLTTTLQHIYPEYSWKLWKFQQVPKGYWSDINNRRHCLETIGNELGIREPEQWYAVKTATVRDRGGDKLLRFYGDFLYRAIIDIYPNYPWQPWRFPVVPMGFWKREDNVKHYVEWLMKKLEVNRADDWLSVSLTDLKQINKGYFFALQNGGLKAMLHSLYPGNSRMLSLKMQKYKSQLRIQNMLQRLFPTEEIHTNYKLPNTAFHNNVVNSRMELDIYLPSLSLALEYQGEQHYENNKFFLSELSEMQERDRQKRELCKMKGITLITIPYWWDRSKESIAATIHAVRKDLLAGCKGVPIPSAPKNLN